MEAKIKIIEVFPKLKYLKHNPKDIISISFISDNFKVKIADLEKAIISNDKIVINLIKKKNFIQPIKYALILNKNNIIATSEFTPTEGVKWYKLNEIKNNISKESLITSSTSNGNIKNNNNSRINFRNHNLSDFNNNNLVFESLNNFHPKRNVNNLNNNNSSINKIKIKFSISFSKMNNSNKNFKNNHYNNIRNNNYTKEPSLNSSKDEKFLLDKEKDNFILKDFTITESDISKINTKNKSISAKKIGNQKFLSGEVTKRSCRKINFNFNQSPSSPESKNMRYSYNKKNENIINHNKIISRKTNNIINKKFFNEKIKMKTSIEFNKRKKFYFKDLIENKNRNNDEIHKKINSCDNIDDKIFDQNFKNYLKNDEILKENLSDNNSLILNNNNDLRDINICNTLSFDCKDFIPQTFRDKISNSIEKKIKNKKLTIQDLNSNSFQSDSQLLKTNSEFGLSNESISKNIIISDNDNSFGNRYTDNTISIFERLKNDFSLLYSSDNINQMNNDILFLEMQIMIEKILELQNRHQKEYRDLFNSINLFQNIFKNYQYQCILLFKKINKLKAKNFNLDLKIKRKKYCNKNIKNFINRRKKIINKDEFSLWDKMLENSNKTIIQNNSKKKMINIFLKICEKNENNLNKLSMKFYKDTNNRNSKININDIKNKRNNYNSYFSENQKSKMKSKIKENEDINLNYKLINNNKNKIYSNSNNNKYKLIKKNGKKINSIKNDLNSKNILNNVCNMNNNRIINENLLSNNVKKINNNNKYKSISFLEKIYPKKRDFSKSE